MAKRIHWHDRQTRELRKAHDEIERAKDRFEAVINKHVMTMYLGDKNELLDLLGKLQEVIDKMAV